MDRLREDSEELKKKYIEREKIKIDKDIEEKMGDLDTEEEMFVSKITDMANDIVGDVIDTVGKMVDGTKTALPRPVEYDLNKLI